MAQFYGGPFSVATIAVDGTTSNSFDFEFGAKTLQLHIPIVSAGTTLALQATAPKTQENAADAWVTISVFDLSDGTLETLDGMGGVAAQVVIIPASATGPGPLRFLASGAQADGAISIKIAYGTFR